GSEGVTEGELWTRSPTVTRGYHNLPQVTREKIVDGWLRTGDVFRVDPDGFYYFMGRVDDMFSCGGEENYFQKRGEFFFSPPAVRDRRVVARSPRAQRARAPGAA